MAGRIGDAGMGAVEEHAAADGIIGIGEERIKVGVQDIRSGADEMGVGAERQPGLIEHAHHAGDARILGDGFDLQGVVQAACLARFDVEQITCVHCQQPCSIVLIEQGFVGHDGDGTDSVHAGQSLEIPVGNRLFAEFDIEGREVMQRGDGCSLVPALIGVDANGDIGS